MGSIREEIKQTRPFASLATEAVLTLLRTADQVRACLAAVVEPHGITPQQYNVLRILRGAGPGGLPTLEIAVRMIERSPGITRLLDRLQAKGLVSRRRCPEDRRQVLCCATAQALSLVGRLDRPMDEATARALAPLRPPAAARLIRLLDSVRAHASPRPDRKQEKERRS
ncbi:MAG TPA: MarR family transcriptional regulator [Vicinamibacteria bacterium]|nr:MarR family transcriptional regulator [Vicinamibacteria bacterium]